MPGTQRATISAWRPVLDGPAAEQASAAVEAITAGLSGALPSVEDAAPALLPRHVWLESGRSGLALFYAYRARSSGGLGAAEEAATLLGTTLVTAPNLGLGPSLVSGVAGIGWAAAHLQRLGITADDGRAEAACAWADARIAAALDRPAEADTPDAYDLLYGLVGLGVYALERLPEPSAVTLLTRLVERLRDQAEEHPDGITWWTPPVHTHYPHGWYNLGLAHGVPGIVAFLGLVCAANVAAAIAWPLLDGAVSWLLAQRLPDEAGPRFPPYLIEGTARSPSRLAWCYGDPGVAAALLVAARAVGQPAWEQEAIALAVGAARLPLAESGVIDAPLCHGAVGLGHVYNRIYQATGEARLGEAARVWLERGLAMRRPGGKLGGFYALVPDTDGQTTRRVAYRGILQGAAGIGLALLAATTDVEPTWDRILLLN